MGENGELKQFDAKPSGRRSIIEGAKFTRGVVIVPQQILELFHDVFPALPIPSDAHKRFTGIELKDEGANSAIGFHFKSLIAPEVHCFSLEPNKFLKTLVELADGLLPLDCELDGFELANIWTYVMIRVKSSHWPPTIQDNLLPLVNIRYDLKRLIVDHSCKTLEEEMKRIRIQ